MHLQCPILDSHTPILKGTMKKPVAAAPGASEHKPGPKVATIRQDVKPRQCTDFAHFIGLLGPRRQLQQALGITYVTLMRRLQEPATLTVQELYRLAEASNTTMADILMLLRPSLAEASASAR